MILHPEFLEIPAIGVNGAAFSGLREALKEQRRRKLNVEKREEGIVGPLFFFFYEGQRAGQAGEVVQEGVGDGMHEGWRA